jgi:hypothetical protein
MKHTVSVISLAALALAVSLQAQTTAPKPDPELQKLQILAGQWSYEGTDKGALSGHPGKFTGEYTGRMILGGFFFQDESVEKAGAAEMKSLDIYRYDPVNKNFPFNQYLSDGNASSGTLTVRGNTLIWESPVVAGGEKYLVRDTFLYDPRSMSFQGKAEVSADGKTWRLWYEAKYTKVKPAPPKK